MFKECFKISLTTIKCDTIERKLFFKKYTVFDGLGSYYFSSKKDAYSFVLKRSKELKRMFDFGMSIYSTISDFYVKRLVKFRKFTFVSYKINNYLSLSLDVISWLSSSKCRPSYILSKIKILYQNYIEIVKLMNQEVYFSLIIKKYNDFFISYPTFRSADYQQNKNIKHEKVQKIRQKTA